MTDTAGEIRKKNGRWVPGQSGNPATRFVAGQSANPGGRPKDLASLRGLIRDNGVQLAEGLLRIAKGEDEDAKPADRIRAAEILISYWVGRPQQSIEVTQGVDEGADALREELERLRKDPKTAAAMLVLAEATSGVTSVSVTIPPSASTTSTMSTMSAAPTHLAQETMPPGWFIELLKHYPRIAIAGGPNSGKTTLTKMVHDRHVIHSDDYSERGWSDAFEAMARAVNDHDGPLIVEGVKVPRALLKGMRIDCVVWLEKTYARTTKAQQAMATECLTAFNEWRSGRQAVLQFDGGMAIAPI